METKREISLSIGGVPYRLVVGRKGQQDANYGDVVRVVGALEPIVACHDSSVTNIRFGTRFDAPFKKLLAEHPALQDLASDEVTAYTYDGPPKIHITATGTSYPTLFNQVESGLRVAADLIQSMYDTRMAALAAAEK